MIKYRPGYGPHGQIVNPGEIVTRAAHDKKSYQGVEATATGIVATPEMTEKFWALVQKQGSDDCWNWAGSTHWSGYGRLKLRRESYAAHRVSLAIVNGGIPANVLVCHSCDNPSCVNPSHLFLGSHLDNMRDKMKKGRWRGPSTVRETAAKTPF